MRFKMARFLSSECVRSGRVSLTHGSSPARRRLWVREFFLCSQKKVQHTTVPVASAGLAKKRRLYWVRDATAVKVTASLER
ncbi:hypothetical protein CDAR_525681 [Caerostris darwini]|uniref:Uncharacterized protein n=1 Tax=Caerostris darwini TaxID=1538125 RepID=A0AAV4Q3D7_9ARAC|nr:hypothetical protein CDAR_525681 [Caerostris darwini]